METGNTDLGRHPGLGSGVICGARAFQAAVIPAKAGIQSVDNSFPKVCGVDSRFRGNDWGREHRSCANDATTDPDELLDAAFSWELA